MTAEKASQLDTDIETIPVLNVDQTPLEEKSAFNDEETDKPLSEKALDLKSNNVKEDVYQTVTNVDQDQELETDRVIRDGHDVSEYLLSVRDDGDSSITFRCIVLATLAGSFSTVLGMLYSFKPTPVSVSGSFMIVIVYFMGNFWGKTFPSGKKLRERWGDEPTSKAKRWLIKIAHFINPCEFGLKEHAIIVITASSASNGSSSLTVFATQMLYYKNTISAGNVVMTTVSMGLFGYGLCGLLRPLIIAPSEMVYWTNIPMVQMFQRLHWDSLASSKPLRYFWYALFMMAAYEFLPAYIFPLLVAFSIPCLASQNAPVSKQQTLTNLFGGAIANEGLGLFSICLDWQYITSAQTSLPLIQQANSWVGFILCYIIFIILYYTNAFGAKNLPFLATGLFTSDGQQYPAQSVFVDGILDRAALEKVGPPQMTATFAYGMLAANLSVGALIAQVFFFWGKQAWKNIRERRDADHSDRHIRAMTRYKDVSNWWYAGILFISFILGLAANMKEDTTLSIGAYILALVLGTIVTPFSSILFGMFGNGVETALLMMMVAGVVAPGRPLANMYFTCWSHGIISQALNLASDLKLGIYLKIPPFVMFATQVIGTILGSFLNYLVMVFVIDSKRAVLLDGNGNAQWTGTNIQSGNTQAMIWSLTKELYTIGKPYAIVPIGLVIGFVLVACFRVFVHYVPKIGKLKTEDINIPVILMYSGFLAYNQLQACITLSSILAGVFVQFYLRNYKPTIFKKYSYIVPAGMDGGSLITIFVLSFAVFGAAGIARPFPTWWGNPADLPDRCPDPSSSS